MEVKVKKLITEKELNIISDDKELIADIILKELCVFDKVLNGEAYYKSDYNFKIKNLDEIADYILISATKQTHRIINSVYISTYYNKRLLTKLLFDNKKK